MSQGDDITTIETLFKRTLLLNEEVQNKLFTTPDKLLQLRKDQESTLKKVLHMHRSLCLALGIEGGKSPAMNLERATHALGIHDLQKKFRLIAHIANLFAEVTAFVERYIEQEKKRKQRIAALEEKNQAPTKEQKKTPEKTEKAKAAPSETDTHELREAADLQFRFQHSIEQLTEALHKYSGLAEFGLLLNHVSGIQHPHSQFYISKTVPHVALDRDQIEQEARIARLMPHP